jgi:hypothetical protein
MTLQTDSLGTQLEPYTCKNMLISQSSKHYSNSTVPPYHRFPFLKINRLVCTANEKLSIAQVRFKDINKLLIKRRQFKKENYLKNELNGYSLQF